MHSAIKLEKSAISKVQKHIFCNFKNDKKSIFATVLKVYAALAVYTRLGPYGQGG